MKKLYNNRFIFIVCISLVFIMVISFGTITLTKKNTVAFLNDGYVISNNKVIDFKSGTSYRLNLNKNIVFSEGKDKIHEIPQDSFIHYNSGSLSLLKTGALIDLDKIEEDIMPYYNITNKSIINYNNGGYIIKNGNDELQFNNMLIRINENKFLIAGNDLKVKISGVEELLKGQYFEITFIEDGVVLVENSIDSFQVTAEGSLIYIDDSTIIDLSTKNILKDNKTHLNMTELTIDGNENITIVPDEKAESTQDESTENGGTGNGNEGTNNGNGNGNIGENTEKPEDKQVSVDLVDLSVGIKDVTAVLQVNNSSQIKGDLDIVITNIETNEKISPTFKLTETGYLSLFTDKLNGNSNYIIKISEKRNNEDIEYFQRMFSTNSFLVKLEKKLITETQINYKVNFLDNSNVEEIIVALSDNKGNIIKDTEKTVNKANNNFTYDNLTSNTSYKIKVIGFKLNSATFMDKNGFIVKTVKTLKQKPTYETVKVVPSNNLDKFTLSIAGINDPDLSIKNYKFIIFNDPNNNEIAEEIDSSSASIEVEIGKNKIVANKNYKFKTVIEYNDNEKNRELITHSSSKFISTGASVEFEQNLENSNYSIQGQLTLKDPDCTIPIKGRTGCDGDNNFSISYYVNGIQKLKQIEFSATEDKDVFKSNVFTISGLNANTKYPMELIGDVKEEIDGVPTLISKTTIGNPFTGKTKEAKVLKITKKSDNLSTEKDPINVTVSLDSNSENKLFINQIKTMRVSLYVKDLTNNKVKVGEDRLLTNEEIIDLLYKRDYSITNEFFKIEDINKLKELASDTYGWLYSKYIIEFSDAYVVPIEEVNEKSPKVEIVNNEIETEITKSFLLDYYAKEKDKTKAHVVELENSQLSEKNEQLDNTTVAAYRIDGESFVEDILRQYYGTTGVENTINWDYRFYIYKVTYKLVNDKKVEDDELIYTSPKQKNTSHTFYLDDENIKEFDRGNQYKFGFQILIPDGTFPKNPTIATYTVETKDGEEIKEIVNPLKENPKLEMAIWDSTESSLTFKYKIIKDIDEAFYENKLFISKDSDNNKIIDSQEIVKSEDYNLITFNNLLPNSNYRIKFNKKNITEERDYIPTSNGGFIFDGLHNISSDYELVYKSVGNQLSIVFNNIDFVKRANMYEVLVTGGNKKKEFLIPNSELKNCNNKNCLIINYQDLEEFQGLNCKVSIKGYYENGLIGLNQKSKFYIFKTSDNIKFLKIDDKGKVTGNAPYADGLYTFKRNNLEMEIKNNVFNHSWNDSLISKKFQLSIGYNTVGYSNYGNYNPKVIGESVLTTSNDNFVFSGIIPMSKINHTRKINNVTIGIEPKGLTKTIINNEFNKKDQKIYIDLYNDETYINPITISNDIDINNPSKRLNFKFTNLNPAHKYYYKVYANILNKEGKYERTDLFDYREDGQFTVSERSINTLSAIDIFANNDILYSSKSKKDAYMTRNIRLVTHLKDVDNYKLKYSITDENGNIFKDKIETDIKSTMTLNYDISDNKFIFNNPKYKFKLTAITDDTVPKELVLYDGEFIPHLDGNNDVRELREPSFKVINSQAYVPSGEHKYAIKFGVQVNDNDKVIKNADYYVQMVDDNGKSYAPVGYSLDQEGYIKLNLLKQINTTLNYKNLTPDTYYTINVKANTYRNNSSLTEKNGTTINSSFIQTGDDYNIDLGEGTLEVNDNILSINYTNASNLNKVTKIATTVFKNNTLYGNYNINGSKLNFINNSGKWKLNLDLSNNPNPITSNDKVRIIVRYYANGLSGTEGLVDSKTYVNYENE